MNEMYLRNDKSRHSTLWGKERAGQVSSTFQIPANGSLIDEKALHLSGKVNRHFTKSPTSFISSIIFRHTIAAQSLKRENGGGLIDPAVWDVGQQ